MAGIDNLKPFKSVDEAREKGRKGGIKSGESKRKKKLMSMIYADYLSKGEKKVNTAIDDILSDTRATVQLAKVALLKNIAEVTESPPRKKIDFNKLLDD